MQTNLLLNVLMSAGGMGLTPPSNPLLGTQLATATGLSAQGTIGEFAGLLGQPGKQSDLALLTTNTPTGDIEASPQALDIAPFGLSGLATYIDQPTAPVLKNQTDLIANTGNTIDSKKATVASQALQSTKSTKSAQLAQPTQAAQAAKLASLSKPAISKDMAQLSSDVVNEQEFQNAIKNIEAQKQTDGKIKLADLPQDIKTELSADETSDIMSKVAGQLNETTDIKKPTTAKTAQTANNAENSDNNAKIVPANAKDSAEKNLLDKFSNPEELKVAAKSAPKDAAKFAVEGIDSNPANTRLHEIQTQLKEVRVDSKAEIANAQSAANQVEVKIAQMIKDGVDMVRIKLHPEDLGKIDIQMDVGDDGKTAIRIIADKVETLEMLRRDSHSLEKALKDTGVRTDAGSLQFSLRDPNSNQQQNFANFGGGKSNYSAAQMNDNYLKAANVNEYTIKLNTPNKGVNILA